MPAIIPPIMLISALASLAGSGLSAAEQASQAKKSLLGE